MFTVLDRISWPGHPDKPNEDICGVSGDWAWVIDTSIFPGTAPVMHDEERRHMACAGSPMSGSRTSRLMRRTALPSCGTSWRRPAPPIGPLRLGAA